MARRMANQPKERSKARIKFENPPVIELVLSIFHLPIQELKAQHIGLYWDSIRAKYPKCEQQTLIVSPADGPIPAVLLQVPGEPFPLPRFWFFNDDHPILIQVQRNAFMVNWRRFPGVREYPHYENVAKDFWAEFETYKQFIEQVVHGKLDVIQRCELNYINMITKNAVVEEEADLMKVVRPTGEFYTLENNDRKLTSLGVTATYRVSPSAIVELTIRGVGVRQDTNEHVASLELKAIGAPSDLSVDAARDWYDAAHDAIYRLFLDATAGQVQEKIWKPR
jgi:uncharacterized protein (TIGR04255 family)